jgi:NitT/TauT family transport system substrate-binding protein
MRRRTGRAGREGAAAARGSGWSRREALGALAALATASALGACRSRAPLRVAAHVWPGYELLFLAAREGWLPAREAELVETPSATESLRALREEAVDGAALTLDEVLRARAAGVRLSVVLVLDVSAGGDVVLARPGVTSPRQLAGRRIGVENTGVGALMLHHFLRVTGIGLDAIQVVPVTADAHAQAWRAGWVDFLVTFEPIAAELEALGAVRVFDSGELPGTIVDVLAVRPPALRRDRALRAVVAAAFAARRHLVTNRQDAAYRMSRHLRLTPAQVVATFRWLNLPDERLNRELLGGAAPGLVATARELSSVMVAAGLLARADPLDQLVRPEFLPAEAP